MTSQLKYLEDTTRLCFSSSIVRIDETPTGIALVLAETWFYPQGGGQASDRGVITGDGLEFAVTRVDLVNDDVVHQGELVRGKPEVGQKVDANIDSAVRTLNSRLHSGGHVIMAAVERLVGLPALKGYHFPDGPYVEFEGTIPPEDRPTFPDKLQNEVDLIVEADGPVRCEYESVESLRSRGVHIPMEIPANKPTRVVTMAGYDSPCGGTHVERVRNLGTVQIRKVKTKSGRTRVGYQIKAAE